MILSDVDLERIAALLEVNGESVAGPLEAIPLAGGRSNLTYRLEDGVTSWALRRPPHGGVIESAHDVVREYRVVSALRDTGVPVARAVACDPDGSVVGSPIAIVSYVEGRTARSADDVDSWSQADFDRCASGMIDVLVALHSVVPERVGLGDFGRPGGYAQRQVRRWSRQWESMAAQDDRADMLLAQLGARLPGQSRTGIVHGDYRVDNVILDASDPGTVLAVLDWELSTLGDPVADVALMCAYRNPALDGVLGIRAAWTSDGFPAPDRLRDMYEHRSGAELPDFTFHQALAFYKLAVIAEGIAYRHRLGATVGEGYDGVADTVGVFLAAGLEVLGSRD